MGDHLYSCASASKTPLSNAIRDTLYDILCQIAPAAEAVDTPHVVHIEPPGLTPQHQRNIRPADVGMLLSKPHKHSLFQYVAIDITIPPPQQPQTVLDPSDCNTLATLASRTHQEAARAKFCRDPETSKHLLHNGIYLLPFTVDPPPTAKQKNSRTQKHISTQSGTMQKPPLATQSFLHWQPMPTTTSPQYDNTKQREKQEPLSCKIWLHHVLLRSLPFTPPPLWHSSLVSRTKHPSFANPPLRSPIVIDRKIIIQITDKKNLLLSTTPVRQRQDTQVATRSLARSH